MRKSTVITWALLIYMVVMASTQWKNYHTTEDYLKFAGIVVAELIVIFCLRFVLRRKENRRAEIKKKSAAQGRRRLRNDDVL